MKEETQTNNKTIEEIVITDPLTNEMFAYIKDDGIAYAFISESERTGDIHYNAFKGYAMTFKDEDCDIAKENAMLEFATATKAYRERTKDAPNADAFFRMFNMAYIVIESGLGVLPMEVIEDLGTKALNSYVDVIADLDLDKHKNRGIAAACYRSMGDIYQRLGSPELSKAMYENAERFLL